MTIKQRLAVLINSIRAQKGKKVLAKAVTVSVLNQAVSSGTNFALGIYLVRMLPAADFGLYGIGFAISLFYAGIGNALFLIQMVVHTPDKLPEDRLPYAGRMFTLVALLCAGTVALLAAILLLGANAWEPVARYSGFVAAVTAASIAYLLKDFFVRHAYNMRREVWALSIHGAIAVVMASLLALQYGLDRGFSAEMALWIYAVAQACGALLGYLAARLPVAGHRRAALRADLREAWGGGKWASVTNLVYFARTQAHTIVVATLLGPVGVAKINAARLLVTPAVMLTPALAQVAMPRLAAVRQDERRLERLGRWFTLALLAVALLYTALLLRSYDFIVDTLFGDKYQDLLVVTTLWCFCTCILAVRNGAEMMRQVTKQFRKLSRANAYSTLVTLFATYWLAAGYGLQGALIGVVIGEIVLSALLIYGFKSTIPVARRQET